MSWSSDDGVSYPVQTSVDGAPPELLESADVVWGLLADAGVARGEQRCVERSTRMFGPHFWVCELPATKGVTSGTLAGVERLARRAGLHTHYLGDSLVLQGRGLSASWTFQDYPEAVSGASPWLSGSVQSR